MRTGRKSGQLLRQLLGRHADFDGPQVDLEDLLACLDIGQIDEDVAIKAAGACERRVQDVGTVRA